MFEKLTALESAFLFWSYFYSQNDSCMVKYSSFIV